MQIWISQTPINSDSNTEIISGIEHGQIKCNICNAPSEPHANASMPGGQYDNNMQPAKGPVK
jgi:hypothetical protein